MVGEFRRVRQSVLARAFTFPLSAATTVASTAIVVNVAGPSQFAAIALVANLVLLLPYSDLGLGASIINLVASGRSAQDKIAGVVRVIHVLLIPAGVIIAIALLGQSIFSWSSLLGIDYADARSTDTVTATVLVVFAFSIPLGVGMRILTGMGLNHLQNLLSSIASVVSLAVTLLLWSGNAQVLFMAVAAPAGLLTSSVVCTAVAFRRLKMPTKAVFHASGRISYPLFSAAPPMLLLMIGLPLAFQSHRIVLSYQSVPEQLASYSLAMQFYAPAWSFISVAGMALWPIFAARRESDATKDLALLRKATIAFGTFGLAIGLCVGALTPLLASWLSGGTISVSWALSGSVGLLIFAQAVQQGPGMYLTDARGLWFQAACVAVSAIAVLGFSWWLTPTYGAPVPLLVTAACVLLLQVIPGLIWIHKRPERISQGVLVAA